MPIGSRNPEAQEAADETGAIYAVIDKTRKNPRATIHVERDLERQLVGSSSGILGRGHNDAMNYNVSNRQLVYAQVSKHSRQGSGASSSYPVDYSSSGARPKIRSRSIEGDDPNSNSGDLKHKKSSQTAVPYYAMPSGGSDPSREDPYSHIKDKEDPYAKVKDVDVDPYAQIKDATDPYSQIKDPNNPYARIKDATEDSPYSKVKDSDSAGYSRIKDVPPVAALGDGAGYSSIGDVALTPMGGNDPNYAVIPGDRIPGSASDSDPNYDHIPTDNVTTLRVAPGYATEIPNTAADGNNNPNSANNGIVHIGSHQVKGCVCTV